MALVIRNGRSYLYRSVRKGGKVTSQYAGSGDFASLAGRLESLECEERRRQLAEERHERDRLDAQDSPVAEMFHRVEIIATSRLGSRRPLRTSMLGGFGDACRSSWVKRSTCARIARDSTRGTGDACRIHPDAADVRHSADSQPRPDFLRQ